MKSRTFLILILLSAIIIGTSATMPQQEEKTQPEHTNLKVLPKKISHEELEKVMKHYNAALGVRCNFCHVRNEETKKMDYASDAKEEKVSAREMMKMTNKLNIKNFGEKKSQYNQAVMEVSCATCHRGKSHPEK
ncbi:c-type cytochrome [Pedobacter sp. P351]|uniref:c-type cytochrome n=1 Tax=Pedobacter superstes TaxID=3133441 RepID=UPI0030AABCC8